MVEEPTDPIEEALALARTLPGSAVLALFRRYGKPLAAALPTVEDGGRRAELLLDDGGVAWVRVLNLRTPLDVIGNDWFILEVTDGEPLAVAGPLFAAALAALSRAARRRPVD